MTRTWLAVRAHDAVKRGLVAEAVFRRAVARYSAAELRTAAHEATIAGLREGAELLTALANNHLTLEPLLVNPSPAELAAEQLAHTNQEST